MSDLSSDIHTQRSGLSKKEEKITEEWGFKDSKTAELMLARAKKLKYNALNKKKLSQLDAHQRLALMRKLEENARLRPVQPPGRSGLPRKEYFQAKERESNYKHIDEQQENTAKVTRTFEWVHMQVGDHGPPSKLTSGAENLPHMDPTVLAGRRGLLTGSPISLDLQSVDSRVSGEIYVKPRRMSFQEPGKHERLPPIKATSAPATKKLLDEKISRRTQPVNQSVGWGGGRKLQK
ncbi:hypothetical protein CAPTEDRAFT_189398 [Capitella teleta]|uniref:Uncharacterized protein n=1 Tax=Capitella teleta TaxID=283909 RepID=R7UI32_CAPTE|nr:hypothetical protein CAPTEDRAFT_189398 [Capitella teleta]|eukprot:ELU05763.1 hypothetical protein CAPTEDRAFT_189398 [Capitella teleta]